MSGIYGIYRYDGAPVDLDWLDRMHSAMAYYGPHGHARKIEGAVGMGHLLLELNPEDCCESQPVRTGRGLVVSAARLDNRDELLDTFGISAADAAHTTDSQLVARAFDHWSEDLCPHLEGDWSLAAWNATSRRLLLARDAIGNSTLYYYQGKGFIAFASALKALLALPGVAKEPDLLRLAEVLVSWPHDPELTAYMGFRRILWSQVIIVGPEGQISKRQYWTPEGREPLRYPRNENYEEAFLEHYRRAVRSCLRTQKPVAAQLSGGRDSGSVVTLAAPVLAMEGRELTAFTSVPCLPPDGAGIRQMGNEWDAAHATATMAGPNVRHVPIDAANYGVIQGIEYVLDAHDGPSHASVNHYWLRAIMETASSDGAGVILTGQMGNDTISWPGNGSALLALLRGQYSTALRLLLYAEPNPWLTLKRQVLKPLLTPVQRAYRRFRTSRNHPWQAYSALNVHLAKSLELDYRMREAGHDTTFTFSPLDDLRPVVLGQGLCITPSIWTDLAAKCSIGCLDPTANLAMLEFLLRVPDDQYCQNGRSSLLRRTLRNQMPESVLNVKSKGLQAADVGHRIRRETSEFRQCLNDLDSLPQAREILDMPRLHSCLDDIAAKVDPVSTSNASMILLRGLGVGLFLRKLARFRS